MSEKRERTLLVDVATKIGSTLGVVAAEAGKVLRPLRSNASRVLYAKSHAARGRRNASARSVTRKHKPRRRGTTHTSKARVR